MPMVIELSRRALLGAGAAAVCGAQAAPAATALWAAWDVQDVRNEVGAAHHIGLLRLGARAANVQAALALPTRAHGLALTADGALIAVARRPGDWLVRWPRGARTAQWHWNAAGRVFNGHARVQGKHLYTTETELETGQGMVVLRDARTLRELGAWPTHGRDPHDLLFDRQGGLWIANGGIATDAATGRAKDTRAMDSSLVCLQAGTRALLGQWRLEDNKLSLRHLAMDSEGRIGIALQAEHANPAQRAAAPLLALWQQGRLVALPGPPAAGYAGDIVAHAGAWFVSAARAGQVLAWAERSGWMTAATSLQPCALAAQARRLWCGQSQGLSEIAELQGAAQPRAFSLAGLRLDNHMLAAAA